MARRCLSNDVCSSDNFLSLPHSSQALYFQFCLNADNEGFVNNPKSIMKSVNCNQVDIDNLIKEGLIFYFKTGVCVVIHWLIHNTLKNDRNNNTSHQNERILLEINNKKYTIKDSQNI